MHEGGLLSRVGEKHVTFWQSAGCTRLGRTQKMHNGGDGCPQKHNSVCFHGRRACSLRAGRTQIVSAVEAPLWQVMQARACRRSALFCVADELLQEGWGVGGEETRKKKNLRLAQFSNNRPKHERKIKRNTIRRIVCRDGLKKNMHENNNNPHPLKKCKPRYSARRATRFKGNKVTQASKEYNPVLRLLPTHRRSSPQRGTLRPGETRPAAPQCPAANSPLCNTPRCLPYGSVRSGADGAQVLVPLRDLPHGFVELLPIERGSLLLRHPCCVFARSAATQTGQQAGNFSPRSLSVRHDVVCCCWCCCCCCFLLPLLLPPLLASL